MSNFKPDPNTVKEMLAPGLWISHENELHFDAPTFLEGKGFPVNDRNILLIEEQFLELARAMPNNPIITHEFHDESPKSGDEVETIDGTKLTMPFANEHPCFGGRQGYCKNLATWRVEGTHVLLHFCDECQKRPNVNRLGKWTKLEKRP